MLGSRDGPFSFRWFVAASVTVWLAVLVPVTAVHAPAAARCRSSCSRAARVVAEHRFVLFGDETSMSGSIIVVVASVFVFADQLAFAGPILIASLGGLYLPHFQARRFGLVVANCSIFAIAVASAAAAKASVGHSHSTPRA